MAKIYNKIVESTTEPSKEDLWLKEGKVKKFKNGWEDISGKSDAKIPTKVSQLENDSGFVTKVGGLARQEEDGTYLNNIDRVVLERIGYDYYTENGNVYFTPHSTSVYENGDEITVNVLKGKVHGLGTAAYKNVEEIVELVKQSINA